MKNLRLSVLWLLLVFVSLGSTLSLAVAYQYYFSSEEKSFPAGLVIKPYPIIIQGIVMAPMRPDYESKVMVTATITGESVDALLYYTYNSAWQSTPMDKSGDTYNATIPKQPYGTLVQYRIHASDTHGYEADSDLYSYSVVDDVKPELTSLQNPVQPRASQTVKVSANVIEPANASGVRNVTFYYRVNNNPWWSTSMVFNSTLKIWETTIPSQQAHDLVDYYIKALDNAGNENTTKTFSYIVALQGDANLDHIVDIFDRACISAHWTGPPAGPLGYDLNYDLNSDGFINIVDSAIVSSQWHQTW